MSAVPLYELDPDVQVPRGLPLVVLLTGFTDAGSAVAHATEYLLETLDHQVVAEFRNDDLLDYRARRPTIVFDEDHLTDYQAPQLALRLAEDELGAPFLMLTGYEPDFRWEQFTAELIDLVKRLGVSSTVWVHAIPMPVPHTRPIGTTVSGNRMELIEAYSVWRPRTQVPVNVGHLIEYRLAERDFSVASFALLIPHYLADTEYPAAAVAAIERVSLATGLMLPSEDLREDDREFLGKLTDQMQNNVELQRLVATLEERHDDYMESANVRNPLTDLDGEIPSAEVIAEELERFLAAQNPNEDEV